MNLVTETKVSEHDRDCFVLNGSERNDKKVANWLSLLRKKLEIPPICIESEANFPANSGLASSAAGFAALTMALDALLNWNFTQDELVRIASLGSVSAARSIHGGFVALIPDDEGCKALQLHPTTHWDLRVLIAITDETPKMVSSSDGMRRSQQTSPYYGGWLESTEIDFGICRSALFRRDFESLGRVIEDSCCKMHALMLSSKPALIYWNGCSLEIVQAVQNLRHDGTLAYFTSDAGAQVKVVCLADDVDVVRSRLEQISGISRILVSSVGNAAHAFSDS